MFIPSPVREVSTPFWGSQRFNSLEKGMEVWMEVWIEVWEGGCWVGVGCGEHGGLVWVT